MRNVELGSLVHIFLVPEDASLTFFALLFCKEWAWWHSVFDNLCHIAVKLHEKTMEAEAIQVTKTESSEATQVK